MTGEVQYLTECVKCPPEDGRSDPKATRARARGWADRHNDWHEEMGDDRQLILVTEVIR